MYKPGMIVLLIAVLVLMVCGLLLYQQIILNVPSYHIGVQTKRTGKDLSNDMELAPSSEYKGVQKQILSEGRYFVNPYSYDWEIVPMPEVPNGKLGVRIRQYGDDLPYDQLVAENENEKGVVAEVLKPGRYPINAKVIDGKTKEAIQDRAIQNYAEVIELHEPVVIEAGHKGLITNLSGKIPENPNVLLVGKDERGPQKETLNPGTYYINPYVSKICKIDCRSQRFNLSETEEMRFPSKDGFGVVLDGVIEFRVMPEKAAEVFVIYNEDENDSENNEIVRDEIIRKVILPNALSFCRLRGSSKIGREFIGGETRTQFQKDFQVAMKEACEPVGIEIIQALITSIRPPEAIAGPVRQREVAHQQLLQYKQQKSQQEEEAKLASEKKKVEQKQKLVDANREVIKLTVKANEELGVAVTKANEELGVAKLRLEAAKDEAAAIIAQKKAEAGVIMFQNQAEAAGWKAAIEPLGSGQNFARHTLLRKLAPSYKRIMSNSANSPLMEIFKDFKPTPVETPMAPASN